MAAYCKDCGRLDDIRWEESCWMCKLQGVSSEPAKLKKTPDQERREALDALDRRDERNLREMGK